MRHIAPALALLCVACATTDVRPDEKADDKPDVAPPPFAAYVPPKEPPDPPARDDSAPVLIRNATILTAAGGSFPRGHILLDKGRIRSVGEGPGAAPDGATVIDAQGRFVTPGLIDSHSHLGVYPLPSVAAHWDGNEATRPVTAEVWAEHSFWPQDPSIWRALSGGVTTIQVLPGSANLIGGRSFVAKLRPDVSARLMRFPGAPQGLKMACGENPKRVYGSRYSAPSTRMGNVAGYRAAFQRALEYKRRWDKYARDLALWQKKQDDKAEEQADDDDKAQEKRATKRAKKKGDDKPDDPPEPPARDLQLETLAAVLDGKLLVHNHCYRADEMSLMLDLAKEYGFHIRSFHHALEAYKIRHRLAEEGVATSTWADWWGFKMEAFDGIPQNLAMLADAGARAIVHSDSETDIRHLNQEAQKARVAGRKVGIELDDNEVLRWVTANPAWALGVDDQVGTLEVGKMADVVVWDQHPFSVYARATKVFIDGELVYDRDEGVLPLSDFELGITDPREQP